jgi:hypothetical protein
MSLGGAIAIRPRSRAVPLGLILRADRPSGRISCYRHCWWYICGLRWRQLVHCIQRYETEVFAKVIWGAQCRKSARWVLLGETSSRSYARSVRALARKRQIQRGSAKGYRFKARLYHPSGLICGRHTRYKALAVAQRRQSKDGGANQDCKITLRFVRRKASRDEFRAFQPF